MQKTKTVHIQVFTIMFVLNDMFISNYQFKKGFNDGVYEEVLLKFKILLKKVVGYNLYNAETRNLKYCKTTNTKNV